MGEIERKKSEVRFFFFKKMHFYAQNRVLGYVGSYNIYMRINNNEYVGYMYNINRLMKELDCSSKEWKSRGIFDNIRYLTYLVYSLRVLVGLVCARKEAQIKNLYNIYMNNLFKTKPVSTVEDTGFATIKIILGYSKVTNIINQIVVVVKHKRLEHSTRRKYEAEM